VRTIDIDSVGDESHFTFFEMMGNWSLGDYFKKEKTAWTFELLTEKLGFDKDKICASVFAGDETAPRDEETAELLLNLGIKKENIFFLPKKDNWWELEGTTGTPCGPDNEWFYPRNDDKCSENCDITCDCGRYVEIGNDVYMQYEKTADGYKPLSNKNVDTGFGFERLLMFLNGLTDGYKIDIFKGVISILENTSGIKYGTDAESTKAMRIIADHLRTATMLIGDVNGILPSNVGSGYILRRLMRRAIRYARKINVGTESLLNIIKEYIENIYGEAYPLLVEKEEYIVSEVNKEIDKFNKTIEAGTKEFEKVVKCEVEREEPSVIIAQRPCALLKTVKYTGHCKITENCKNCKMCMKLGCPAITIKNDKVVIDQTQCNGCGLCINVCPFNAIEKEEN
jgi:alanyl-tRNA synthetase